jgi:hypothetical protein
MINHQSSIRIDRIAIIIIDIKHSAERPDRVANDPKEP